MKNKIIFALVFVLSLSFYSKVFASNTCSPNGYSIFTINGIFTDEISAIKNRDALRDRFRSSYNNQPLILDYLYNPTHLAGVGDVADAIAQGVFDRKSDYDLVEMINDASRKVTTQKLLLVAHSQGNFYANNFYDKLASQPGGVPAESVGVYGVGSPADKVSGGGKYITSDTDSVIAGTVAKFIKILPPNAHITLAPADGNGHSFSDVYLKYQSGRIISEIKSSLDKLKGNDEQLPGDPCIAPPELSTLHKIEGVALASADFTIDNAKTAAVYIANGSYNMGGYIGAGIRRAALSIGSTLNNLFANAVSGLDDVKSITTLPPDLSIVQDSAESAGQNINTEQAKPIEPAPVEVSALPVELNPEAPAEIAIDDVIKNTEEQKIEGVQIETQTDGQNAEQVTENKGAKTNPEEKTNKIEENPYPNLLPGGGGIAAPRTSEEKKDSPPPPPAPQADEGAKLYRPNFVTVSGNYAYVLSGPNDNALEVIDISDPSNLTHKKYLLYDMDGPILYDPKSMAISGNYAFIVSYGNALEVVDISDPVNPKHVNALKNGTDGVALNHPSSIAISGNLAYISSYSGSSLEIVDISDPANPKHKGNYYGNGVSIMARPNAVAVSGNYAFIVSEMSNELTVLDISNPAHPTIASMLYDGTDGAALQSPTSIYISNGNAYITSRGSRALEIINISNPLAPAHKAKLAAGFGNQENFTPNFVTVSGNYAYLTSWVGETLEIVDISDPTLPSHVGSVSNGSYGAVLSSPSSVYVSGNYAFVSSYTGNALEVVDVASPVKPVHKNKILVGEQNHSDPPIILPSSKKQISNFSFSNLSPAVSGTIDETNHTIALAVPFETDISALAPSVGISEKASVNPASEVAQNFSNPVIYIVTAEDNSTQTYIVTVNILPDPNPVSNTGMLAITGYTFNGNAGDITVNPLANPVNILITASKNVNWMSVKIEKENNAGVYKIYQSGASCVDGTGTCSKTWDGVLTKGGLLQNGTYRLKVHVKDLENNEFYDYLTPYKINVSIS